MRLLSALVSLCLFVFVSANLTGQTLIFSDDFNDSLDVVTNWSNGGADFWDWRADGEAAGGNYWSNRSRIVSPSGGGAIVFNSDSLAAAGVMPPHDISLVSPVLDFSGNMTVYLEFYQYHRNFSSATRVDYSTDGGNSWNQLVDPNPGVTINIETPRLDRKLFDVSTLLAGEPSVLVRFSLVDNHYFWILDDIRFYNEFPILETVPDYLGDTLTALGKPYLVDSLGGAFNPEQLIVKFVPGTPEPVKQDIRDEFSVFDVQYCDCDSLELWFIDGASDPGGNTLGPNGGTIGVLANKDQARSKSEVDDTDLNYYAFSQLQVLGDSCATQAGNFLDVAPTGNPGQSPDATVIAILDTGIDYENDDLAKYLWRSPEPDFFDGMDNDDNCYAEDFIGWNFICDNNNPFDDHSHGTHVTDIVIRSIESNQPTSICDFRVMPLKTHDRNGVAELFDVICATYYAYKNGADVINDSWGWYGEESTLLRAAIEDAGDAGALVVTAAGNDANDIGQTRQYPATHAESNIITVGALDEMDMLADFSNFSATEVDIAAPGTNIVASVPGGQTAPKSGTSMAAPAVSAAAAFAYCGGKTDPSEVRYNVLFCADMEPGLQGEVANQRVLAYQFPCLVPADDIEAPAPVIRVFPNPADDRIWITADMDLPGEVSLSLCDQLGREVRRSRQDGLFIGDALEMDMQNLPAGIYLLSLRTEAGLQTVRLVRQ